MEKFNYITIMDYCTGSIFIHKMSEKEKAYEDLDLLVEDMGFSLKYVYYLVTQDLPNIGTI